MSKRILARYDAEELQDAVFEAREARYWEIRQCMESLPFDCDIFSPTKRAPKRKTSEPEHLAAADSGGRY